MSIKGLKSSAACPSSSSSSASRPGSVSWHPREQIPDFPPVQPPRDDDDNSDEDEDDEENQFAHKRLKI